MARILIIDDDPDLREAWAIGLSAYGHKAAIAPDGVEGMKLIGTRTYDIVLLDVNMPRLNGVEFLKRVRVTEPDLPILAVTATNDVDQLRAMKSAGANGILRKPFGLETLLSAIAEFVGK